jgi:hypothetical protein
MYLPYAGKKRGFAVKAGKLSMELPTDRFYDPLLQRDWRLGKIEIFLSDADKAVLGPVAAELPSEDVEIGKDAVEPAKDTKAEKVEVKPKAEPKPKKKRKPKAKAQDNSIKSTANGERLYHLAKKLGVTSRSILAELRRRGLPATGAGMNLEPDVVDILSEHFAEKPPEGATPPKPNEYVDLGPAAARGVRQTGSAHEVPPGVPGMPSVPASPGAPSLADLQSQNARITLGQPNFGKAEVGSVPKATIEKPTSSLFGSTLDSGTPQAQAAAAEGGE